MRYVTLLLLFVVGTGCYYRQDPLVRAALDLQEAANEFAAQEESRIQQFHSLRLGMSEDDVRKHLGPPTSQRLIPGGDDETREVWTYQGAMRPLGTLIFTNKRLTEIRTE